MHKKTLNIASVCFVALLVVFVMTHKKTQKGEFTNNIQTDGGVIISGQSETDTRQQEILKTVLDQNIKAFEDVSDSFKKKPTDTLSDTIAKNVFSQYIEYNTSKSLDVDKIQAETIEALKTHEVERSSVGAQDIKIGPDTVAFLKSYGNKVAILQTEIYKAIYKISTKTDTSRYIKNIYKKAAELYKRETVPASLVKEHLNIINGYLDYAKGFELLELQSTDPAKSLSGVQLAKEAEDKLLSGFESMKKIILLNKITYTQKEPAYIWFVNATGTEPIKTN